MQPIICPKCQTEVIPHETHIQRFMDCVDVIREKFLTYDNAEQIKMSMNLFNEINDFIISENIAQQKRDTTKQIQTFKRENIKNINKE